MKNRRIIIVSFLICSCLVIGIGYAAFSDVMDINGSAELSVDKVTDGNIIFTKAEALLRTGETATTNTANVNPNNPDKASYSVNDLVTENQTAQFKFTIENTNAEAYTIKLLNHNMVNSDASTYYEITDDLGTEGKTIAANGTLDVIITVTLKSTPTAGTSVNASFLTELSVAPVN